MSATITEAITEQNIYADQFRLIRERLPGTNLPWLNGLRQQGIDDFRTLGFPTTKLENWKYTNVAPVRRTAWGHALDHQVLSISEDMRLQVYSYPEPRLVFVNGHFDQALSTTQGFLLPLSQALEDPQKAAAVKSRFGRYTRTSDHAFAAWNTAFFTDGACIEIPRGVALEEPIHLVFVSAGSTEPLACHPRNLIIAGEGAQVSFTESFLGFGDLLYLTNAVTEIAADTGAVIRYYKVEQEPAQSFHVAVVNAHLDRDASLTSYSLSFGGALVRNDLNVALDGEGAHCTLNGLFAVDGQRLVDNHTFIEHLRPHASSRELYKGVLAGNSVGVFNGTIAVHENAQKTDAVQHSKNLLLSKQAQINTKPQLEIRNNDVRCFHGATIGQIDTEAIFYLKSRGIDEAGAKRILVRGFAGEIIDAIAVSTLRNRLERLVDEWLQGVLE